MSASASNDLQRYLIACVILSALTHLLLLLSISVQAPLQEPTVFVVDLIPPKDSKVRRQIVSPTQPKSEVIPETNQQSDRNTFTKKEQIKRGAPDAGETVGKKSPQPPVNPSKQAAQQSSAPKSSAAKSNSATQSPPKVSADERVALKGKSAQDLKLDSATMLRKFSESEKQIKKSSPTKLQSVSQPRAFSRPAGSGARFIGATGTLDYLPTLPDGDITLLNAKANKFAVFVRRVALRVFAKLRESGWESLSAGEIRKISRETRIEAILSTSGELLDIKLLSGSGSSRFDSVVEGSVNYGAKDPNPPESAVAADGNIHFIFHSRSWSRPAVSQATGAPTERRWILLSTGLL